MGGVHTRARGHLTPDEAHAFAVGDPVQIRVSRGLEESVRDVPEAAPTPLNLARLGHWAGRWAATLALAFLGIVLGEIIIPIAGPEELMDRHDVMLTRVTWGVWTLGFTLFMGAIFTAMLAGVRTPWSRPGEGSSYYNRFSIQEAKDAFRRRAWRDSARWRVNFVVMAGVPLLAIALFGLLIVLAPNGIRFLCGAALTYSMAAAGIAIVRA